MNRPRVSLGLEATRATLNRAVCLQVGRELAKSRQKKGMTVAAVGKSLLLSPAQVTALEAVNPDAFYSAEFYASAMKKYAALVGAACDELERVLVGPERPDLPATGPVQAREATPRPHPEPAQPVPTPAPVRRKEPRPERQPPQAATSATPVRPKRAVMIAASFVVVALIGLPLMSALRSGPTRVPPSVAAPPADVIATQALPAELEPQAENLVASDPVDVPARTLAVSAPAEPAAAASPEVSAKPSTHTEERSEPRAETLSSEGSFGRVRVDKSTWIFVRYTNNSTTERGLPAGSEFVLHQRPIYIAVGTAEGTNVEVAGHTLDNTQFASNGQLRIGASSLATLQRVTP